MIVIVQSFVQTSTTEIGRIEWSINHIPTFFIDSGTPVNDYRIIDGSKLTFVSKYLILTYHP